MKFILATKLEMTRTFREGGEAVPVTWLKAGPCVVTQVKAHARDGYRAVQVGFDEKKKGVRKPQLGHTKATGKQFRVLREFRVAEGEYTVGQTIDVSQFAAGDKVFITGTSKGRGFQGVVKRHHFHGHPASHGHKDQLRMPGSIGAGGVQHVRKGMRMAGRMGSDRVTVHGLEVMAVDAERGALAIKGAVPGARRGLVLVTTEAA